MKAINPHQSSAVQSPAQREGIVAELACLACLAYLFGVAGPAVQSLPSWEGALVYISLPLALTFTLLYGSHIHREMAAVKRTAFLLGTALLMFAGAMVLLGAIVFFGSIFTGPTRGHF